MSKSSRDAVVSGVNPWLTASSYATEEALLPGICAGTPYPSEQALVPLLNYCQLFCTESATAFSGWCLGFVSSISQISNRRLSMYLLCWRRVSTVPG